MTSRIHRAAAHHRGQAAIWRRLAASCIAVSTDTFAHKTAELAVCTSGALLLESLPRAIDRAA